MTKLPATQGFALTAILLVLSTCAFGQNSYKIFDRVTTAGSGPTIFATRTLNLVCPVPSGTFDGPPPVPATLSSTANGTARLFVDNYINLKLDGAATGTNLCTGAANGTVDPTFADCFAQAWHISNATGLNPDDSSFLSTNGVGPVNFTIPAGTHTLEFDEVDPGGLVGSSTIYLVTNCTVSGGTITGSQEITPTSGLTQSFNFSTPSGNQVFTGDWSTAQNSGDLVIQPGTVPSVTNQGISPANWPNYVAGTSFATTQCIPHAGEVDAFGNPLCKAYTLTCTYTGNSIPSGTNCPQSSVRNIYFNDNFDVAPTFQNLITNVNKTNNLGFGLLMGSDNWAPGDCVLTGPEQGFLCPQNLATSFHDILSGGTTKGTNSTFVVVSGVPLPVTVVSSGASGPVGNGGTLSVNTPNPTITFTTAPPTASGNGFTAAPIESVTYGIDTQPRPPATTLDTTFPIPSDQQATPATTPSCTAFPAGTFVATAQPTLTLGSHTLHFFATDCAATEELVYDTSDLTNPANWASFKTVTINVMGQFGGFLQPVDNPPTLNSVKAGSAVPVKFSLGGNYGLNIFASGSPASITTTCSSTAPVDAIETTVTAGGSSLQYDPTSNTYTYVWKTSSTWSSTCRQLVVKFADGTSAYALFKFK